MFGTTSSSALRAGERTLKTVQYSVGLQTRLFSVSSSQRAGHLVTFKQASSPQLQQTLDTLYNKIILPSYLTQEQQKKIYRAKYERELEHEPIAMEIDGVVHKFKYQNMMDLPRTYELLNSFLKSMSRGDFENLPRMLEGIKHAHRKIEPELYVKMIRRAATHSRLDVILGCVKSVKKTGFKLDQAEKVHELLTEVANRAVYTGYGELSTTKALQQTQQILELLEAEPEHQAHDATRLTYPFYSHPLVLATRMHLVAAKSYFLDKKKNADGSVTRYADELVALWPEGKGVLDLEPTAAYTDRSKLRFLMDRNNFIYHVSPIYQALSLSVQLVDPGLGMQLQNRADAVEGEIRAAYESEKRKKGGRGEVMYNWIFNRKEMKEQRAAQLRAEQEAKAKALERAEQRKKRREFLEEQAKKKKKLEEQEQQAAPVEA